MQKYNYEQIIEDGVTATYKAVRERMQAGWYDYTPDVQTVTQWAYKRVFRYNRWAMAREGAKVKPDIAKLVEERYGDEINAISLF